MNWFSIKLAVVDGTGLDRDALHMAMSLFALLLAAVTFRRPVSSAPPWAAVLGLGLANEYYDLHHEIWPERPMWPESLHDLWITMLIPTILLAVTRFAPRLFSRPTPPAAPLD